MTDSARPIEGTTSQVSAAYQSHENEHSRSLVDTLRELHAPVEHYGRLECDGCDFEANYEGEAPEWPCRTADLVYEEVERDDYVSTFKSWRKWGDDRARRKRLASGWSMNDDLNQLMLRQMRWVPRSNKFFSEAARADGAIKYGSAIVPISRQMLDGC